jgi:hypothetical protein
MMRFILAILIAALLPISALEQPCCTLGVITRVAGATTTTLDPANTGAGASLSGGNLILTWSSANASSRSLVNHSTGKFYLEATFGGSMNAGFSEVGIANSSQSMSSGQLGGSLNSGAMGFGDGCFYTNGICRGADGTSAAGSVISMAIDIGANLIWYRLGCGTWNGNVASDPATGTMGFDTSAVTGPYYAAGHVETNSNSVITFNFGATAYSCTVPSGFGNW